MRGISCIRPALVVASRGEEISAEGRPNVLRRVGRGFDLAAHAIDQILQQHIVAHAVVVPNVLNDGLRLQDSLRIVHEQLEQTDLKQREANQLVFRGRQEAACGVQTELVGGRPGQRLVKLRSTQPNGELGQEQRVADGLLNTLIDARHIDDLVVALIGLVSQKEQRVVEFSAQLAAEDDGICSFRINNNESVGANLFPLWERSADGGDHNVYAAQSQPERQHLRSFKVIGDEKNSGSLHGAAVRLKAGSRCVQHVRTLCWEDELVGAVSLSSGERFEDDPLARL